MIHEHLRRLSALAEVLDPPVDDLGPHVSELVAAARHPGHELPLVRELAELALRRVCDHRGLVVEEVPSLESLRAALARDPTKPDEMVHLVDTVRRHAEGPPGSRRDDLDAEIALVALLGLLRSCSNAQSDANELAARLLPRLGTLPPELASVLGALADTLHTRIPLDSLLFRARKTAEQVLVAQCDSRKVTAVEPHQLGSLLDALCRSSGFPEEVHRAFETIRLHCNRGVHSAKYGTADVEVAVIALVRALERLLGGGVGGAPPAPLGPKADSEPQNRLCTILVADIRGALPPEEDPEPDETERAVVARRSAAQQTLRSIGGHLLETNYGIQIVAIFGMDCVREDDARRAVDAAVRLRTSDDGPPGDDAIPRVFLRIGVATGQTQINAGKPGAVVGAPLDLAEDLARMAPHGAILISGTTFQQHQVRGSFNVEPTQVQHRASMRPVMAYLVGSRIALPNPLDIPTFHGLVTSFIGRRTALKCIDEHLDETLDSRAAMLVTVHGQAGVGRSRLLKEFYEGLIHRSEDFFVLQQKCVPEGAAKDSLDSYRLIRSLLRSRFRIDDADPPEIIFRKLRAGLRMLWRRYHAPDHGIAAADLIESLRQLTDLLGGPAAHDTLRPETDGDLPRRRLTTALERVVRVAAACLPVVILCDDIHRADAVSLSLLSEVVGRCSDVRLFVLCTARSDRKSTNWGEGTDYHRSIELNQLRKAQIADIVRDHLRLVRPSVPSTFVDKIAERASGKPLYAVAILELLIDRGLIVPASEAPWSLIDEKLRTFELPGAVAAVEQARLDTLGPEKRRLLTHAAVVGREVWSGAVLAVDLAMGHRQSVGALLDGLSSLGTRRILIRQPTSAFTGEEQFHFAESTMQEVAYSTLPPDRRKRAHAAVVEWLKDRAQGDEHAARLAHHMEQAGDGWGAAHQWWRAAETSASLGANAEALRLLERARDLQERAGQHVHETKSWVDRVRVLLALGRVQWRLQDPTEPADASHRRAEESFLQALGVLDKAPSRSRADARAVGTWRARVEFRLAELYKIGAKYEAALGYVTRSIADAERAGKLNETLQMRALAVFLHRRNKQPDAAIRAAAEGLVIARAERRADRRRAAAAGALGKDVAARWAQPFAQMLFAAAIAHIGKRRLLRAERAYRRAAAKLSESEHPQDLAIALNGIAGARVLRGNLQGAREMFLQSLELKRRVGDPHQIAVAYSNLSEAERKLGDMDSALEHAREAVRLGKLANALADLGDMHRNLAEALLARGGLPEAVEEIKRADELAAGPAHANQGEIWVSLARVASQARTQESHAELRAWGEATTRRLRDDVASRKIDHDEADTVLSLLGPP